MSIQRQIGFWIGAFVVFAALVWLLSGMLLPFVAGMAIAYLLDPVVDRVEKWGASRLVATLLVLLSFVLLVALAVIAVTPLLVQQISGLLERLPELLRRLEEIARGLYQTRLGGLIADAANGEMTGSLADVVQKAIGWAVGFLDSLISGGLAVVNVIGLMTVTPVVAFYLILDWDDMIEAIDGWLPREHRSTIRRLLGEMDDALGGFVRGQGMVCLILGAIYAISLTLIGLNFGFLIGFVTGLISFIPFVGSIIGLVLSLGVALVQYVPAGEWYMVLIVLIIFSVGQFIEGNILQPKLVGQHVRLHPVWLMFALFAFGYLYGFVGMLIAVPIAAMMGVLARFSLSRYLSSKVYLGRSGGSSRPSTWGSSTDER